MNFTTLHKQRKYILITALVGIIGMFCPWVSFGGLFSVNGMHGWGVLIFFAFVAAGVFAYLGNQTEMMAKNNWLIVLGCAAIAALLFLILIIQARFEFSFFGFGFWLVLIAIGALLYFALTMKNPKDDLKQSLSDLKKEMENKLDNNPNT